MQLDSIDIVTVFDDKDVNSILEKIYFNVFFKGGDYNINKLKKQFPNVNIKISKHEQDISTTIIENKIKNI